MDPTRLKSMLEASLATGRVPLSQEIKLRAELARFLISFATQQNNLQYLLDAIEHLETILRRLPPNSTDRPVYLDLLSGSKVSEYQMSNSAYALDQAVMYGQQAKTLASTTMLQQRDLSAYLEILTNLGFALSQQYAATEKVENLHEAVTCGREIARLAPKNSEIYYFNLNNLASRLRLMYNRDRDSSNLNEAMKLLTELSSHSTVGTLQHASAIAQLGLVAGDKFEQTGDLGDLEVALEHCSHGLNSLPAGHENQTQLLRLMVHLHQRRYDKKKDATDLEDLIIYSGRLLMATPPSHSARGRFLMEHLKYLRIQVTESASLPVITSAIDKTKKALSAMSMPFSGDEYCLGILADMLGKQYGLTNDLRHLDLVIEQAITAANRHNENVSQKGSSRPSIDTTRLYKLLNCSKSFLKASENNETRKVAAKLLSETFHACPHPENSAIKSLQDIHKELEIHLQVMLEAIEADRVLSEDEVSALVVRLKDEQGRVSAKANTQRSSQYRPPEYQTGFGQRSLSIEPEGKNLIMNLDGFMSSVLGYDPTEQLTPEQFSAREARTEQEFIQKARSKGRHPNLNLCYTCRDLAQPMQPTEEYFELTTKHVFPIGNFTQLKHRNSCAICRLILSLITTKSNEQLHTRLNEIDPEVQGTRLSSGRLSTGEKLTRVDYGLRHVGELRILTAHNYRQALRQGWELNTAYDSSKSFNMSQVLAKGTIWGSNGQQVSLSLIQSWLTKCDLVHGSACNLSQLSKRAANDIQLTFIDVVRECLVATTSKETYFTLSYVWGEVGMLKTGRANFAERLKPYGLPKASLPKTIRDAMELVRGLGQRYLWVDAICMVQDDKTKMMEDLQKMDIIYGKSFATIVALHGDNASAGLPGVSPGSRSPQFLTTLTVSDRSRTLDDNPKSGNRETIAIVATPQPLHMAIDSSTWNTRGWIQQERFLSRRCLYFSPDAVYFQCSRETLCEGGANEEYKSFMLGDAPLDDEHVLRNANHNNPLLKLDRLYDEPADVRVKRSFQAYRELVEVYTQRKFSYEADILNAFAGMFSVLEEKFESATLKGLPAIVFSHALLWTTAARLPRRGTRLRTSPSMDPGLPNPNFPSWSWAGWDGPVEYRIFEEAQGQPLFPEPVIQHFVVDSGLPSQKIIETHDYVTSDRSATVAQGLTNLSLVTRSNVKRKPVAVTRQAEDKIDANDTGSKTSGSWRNLKKRVTGRLVSDPARNSTWLISGPVDSPQRDPRFLSNVLSFTARAVNVTSFSVAGTKEYLSHQSHVHRQSPQAVRRIHDRNGRHCGLWWEQAGWAYVGQGLSPEAESKIDMLEISRYGCAYRRRNGPSRVEGEIPFFDQEHLPAVGPESGLVNLLVIDWDVGHPDGIGDRVTVAVMHTKAWEAARPREKKVQMA